jgi:hypothetical protein
LVNALLHCNSTTTIQFIYSVVKQTVAAAYTCLFWKAQLQALQIFKELSFGMLSGHLHIENQSSNVRATGVAMKV